ncbi:MAG: pseudaminic acid synthase [bacterium]|nr:pseudaminic acid synthase [bacterium]
MNIGGRKISSGEPCFVIAEMSGNHNQSFDRAVEIIKAVADAGADAVKLQTYTADTMTIDSDKPWFRVGEGDKPDSWKGKTLYELYKIAYTPWDWQPKLKKIAEELGLIFFSTPFDASAVDFLEGMDVPCYKVASFEVVDIPLLKKIARTGKPVILSSGPSSLEDIELALTTLRENGARDIVLLHCISAYPAKPENMRLQTIEDLRKRFNVEVGLSDHSMGIEIPIAARVLGACAIEKHVTLKRAEGGVDSDFSLEPQELKELVRTIRNVEKAMGEPSYDSWSPQELEEKKSRRSLFAVENIKKGEIFTERNIRSIRPGAGIHPKFYEEVLGKKAKQNIERGTPLSRDLVE